MSYRKTKIETLSLDLRLGGNLLGKLLLSLGTDFNSMPFLGPYTQPFHYPRKPMHLTLGNALENHTLAGTMVTTYAYDLLGTSLNSALLS